MRNKKGFTLFELLVVMIIFSIMVGYAIPTFRLYQRREIHTRISGDLNLIKAAIKIYYQSNHSYPAEKDYLAKLILLPPQIIDRPLFDPLSENGKTPYIYKLSPNKKFYLVYSAGTLGNSQIEISDTGKINITRGDYRVEKLISNGSL
jgi:prepilin-type N-terminal cleavage/methylation domain-containing protein